MYVCYLGPLRRLVGRHTGERGTALKGATAMAQSSFTDADIESLQHKVHGMSLSQGESCALAALVGGELSQASDVEPYIRVSTPLGSKTFRIRTPFGTITAHKPPSTTQSSGG